MTNIFVSPDIRKQTLAEAETFLQTKRAKRLVLLHSYKDKAAIKLATLKGKEHDAYYSRKQKVDKAMDKVVEALNSLERAIELLSSTNSNIANTENQERLL